MTTTYIFVTCTRATNGAFIHAGVRAPLICEAIRGTGTTKVAMISGPVAVDPRTVVPAASLTYEAAMDLALNCPDQHAVSH